MLKDIFGSLGFVIVGSDILFWAYFFIMDNTCIPFVLINDRKMIDAKHVHKLLECKYDFKHWIKDVISSFNFKDGIDYISYRYDNNGEQIIDNNSHVFRHDYYLFPKSILCIIYMKCDRSLFKDFIYDIFDCCNIKNDDRVLDIIHRSIEQNTIAQLREEKAALTASALSQQQTQNIVGQLRPTAVPAYPSCSPYQAYSWGQVFGGGYCNNGCGCNNGCCNNNAAV